MRYSPFNSLGPARPSFDKNGHPIAAECPIRVGVFFATRERNTKRIAIHVASDLRAAGFDVDLIDVKHTIPYSIKNYSAAVLAASVHEGNHEKEMVHFVKNHRHELEGMMTAFISVTLSEAGVESVIAAPIEHERYKTDVDKLLNLFFGQTHWRPALSKPVAAALLYSQYNFWIRMVMKRIAKKEGAATDTSQDYDYTDWIGLDEFVDNFATKIRGSSDNREVEDESSRFAITGTMNSRAR